MNENAPEVALPKVVPSRAATWHRVAVYALAACALFHAACLPVEFFIGWYSGVDEMPATGAVVFTCTQVAIELAAAVVAVVTLRSR